MKCLMLATVIALQPCASFASSCVASSVTIFASMVAVAAATKSALAYAAVALSSLSLFTCMLTPAEAAEILANREYAYRNDKRVARLVDLIGDENAATVLQMKVQNQAYDEIMQFIIEHLSDERS
jgi:hypothetical protein